MATVKYSRPIASFRCPTNADIRSLKVHFSPKQEGTGDPSPDNVREIVGWDGVEVYDYTKTDVNTYIVPDEYKKVEYLEGTGTQYIDTQVPISVISSFNTNWELVFAITSFGKTQIIAGNQNWVKQLPIIGDKMRQDWCGTSASFPTSLGQNAVNILKQNGNSLILNAESHSIGNEATGDGHFAIFAKFFNVSTVETSTIAQMRLYGFTAKTTSDVYIAKMIPCIRKSDSKPGLYDMVTKQFFTNAGTGEFLYGPEVSGYTENYEFGVLGKNKFDYTNSDNWRYADTSTNRIKAKPTNVNISIDNNVVTLDRDAWKWGFSFILGNLFKGTSYCLSGNFTNIDGNAYIAKLDSETIQDDYTCTRLFTLAFTDNQVTFTPPTNGIYELLIWKNGTDSISVSNLQLELGSTATAYEPYNPNKTVYGGWVDLISGEVCEEWRTIDLGDCTWIHYGSRDSVFYTRTLNNLKVQSAPNTVISTHYKYEGAPNVTVMNELTISDSQQLNRGNVNICDPNCSEYTIEQFKEAMSGIICAYKAATPNTYHLAPTQLQTFLGQNNVWSNADYIEVEYDLHETQNILARKQFIMANQPHIVKPAAAPLQNFVTDMAAPLNECKVGFKPVQDLHGYDRPWIGGSGKNLFNPNCEMLDYSVYTKDGNNITQSGSDGRGWTNTNFIPLHLTAGTYTISCSDGNNFSYATSLDEFATPTTLTNGGGTFTLSEDCDVKIKHSVKSGNSYPTTFTVQLELGSTATSYEPYENICPISGWNGFESFIAGKNLFNINGIKRGNSAWQTGMHINNNAIELDGTGVNGGWLIKVFPNTAYTYSCQRTEEKLRMRVWLDKDDSVVLTRSGSQLIDELDVSSVTFTTNADIEWALAGFWNNKSLPMTITEMQFEVGSTQTDYELYDSNNISLDWMKTIGGGYIDLTRGILVETQRIFTSTWGELTIRGPYAGGKMTTKKFVLDTPVYPTGDSHDKSFSNIVPKIWKFTECADPHFYVGDSQTIWVFLPSDINNDTLVQIVCNLVEPVIYQLDPVTIKTLKGINNIWSDANGPIEVKYWTH